MNNELFFAQNKPLIDDGMKYYVLECMMISSWGVVSPQKFIDPEGNELANVSSDPTALQDLWNDVIDNIDFSRESIMLKIITGSGLYAYYLTPYKIYPSSVTKITLNYLFLINTDSSTSFNIQLYELAMTKNNTSLSKMFVVTASGN